MTGADFVGEGLPQQVERMDRSKVPRSPRRAKVPAASATTSYLLAHHVCDPYHGVITTIITALYVT